MAGNIERYREEIGRYLGLPPGHVTLFWKGRVALYAILEALGIATEDEVILPAFTCVVVPNAILYTGARPVYADIEPVTFHLDLAKVETHVTNRTKALLAQNTFGLAPPIDELREIARRRDLFLIEDCAHGFGGAYKGQKNGTLADASFFSTQWNKPFSTGLGGIAVTPSPEIAARLRESEARAERPTLREAANLALLLQAHKAFARPETYSMAIRTYRALSRRGLVVGSSEIEETTGTERPQAFLKTITETQARVGLRELARIDEYNYHRRSIAEIYTRALAEMGVPHPVEPTGAEHTYLKYPLFVKNRDQFIEAAAARGIAVSDWFRSPIHPVMSGWEKWQYLAGSNPIGEEKSARVVNLPTQPGVSPKYAHRVVEFLEAHRGWL